MLNSSNGTSNSNGDNNSGKNVIISITSIIVGGIVIIVVAYLMIKCIQKIKMQKIKMYFRSSRVLSDESFESTSNADERTEYISITTNSIPKHVTIERFLDDIQKEKPIRLTPHDLNEFTSNFAVKLGSGGFGVAYKGQFPNGIHIAVKVLHKTLDKKAEEQFMAEIGTIVKTNHINLVRLYGFCYDAEVKALVYEYMENGSLDSYLFDTKHRLEWSKLYEIVVGTAKGIRYLHEECQQRIIHYDIKPGNVLLDSNFVAKVSDFGLAKLCSRDATHVTNTGGRGTPGYAAPEMWLPLPVTHKCDVYSYGMLLFEILGGRRNLELNASESQEWLPRWIWEMYEKGKLSRIKLSCIIEMIQMEKIERMCKVALWCIQYKAEARPSMSNVVRMLEGQEEIMAPPNPFQYFASHEATSGVDTETSSSGSVSSASM
ncbi:rust resistance kinase Lr10-like [Phalaenopsis equestris]|uniref:rust resistance kinase Lr10-like n=1 Tax=Phalaenopsis equestris TaxID=78828 RepID=UPI0009E4D35D|nr:rust resistance kinase Lr10-like [Phalaenopsis equestris]